ncbi:MAG TPA: membrane dipeptidase [Thermodesulfobacteriota bacterium]|nr:membrane dipeptidase [Thermodesulfobacteriota bacterium]
MYSGIKIWDIHSHALLPMFYLKRDLAKRSPPPLFWNPLRSHIDLPRIKQGGVDCLTFTIYVPFPFCSKNYFEEALKMISLLEGFTEKNGDAVELVKSVHGIEHTIRSNRIAVTLAVEGGHILDGKLGNLEVLKERGIIYITLTHLHSNNIAESSFLKLFEKKGLTCFGKEVIKEMERLGILIDVTHCSERAFWEVLETVDSPIIYSHGGVRRYCDIERNLSDAQIKAIAERGGVIGIMCSPWYLKKWNLLGGIKLFTKTVEYIAEVGGINSVAIGSDFDGWIWTLRGLRDISSTWKIVEGLRRVYNEEAIKKICFENVRQVIYRVTEKQIR